jgi:hypothetical protein
MVTNQSLQNILLPALSTTPSQSERRPVLRRRRVAPPPAPPLALLPHPHASAGRGSAQSAAAPVPSCGGATGPTPASVSSTPICGANRHRSSAARLCPPPAANSLARYLALANVQQQRQCLCPLLAWQLHQRHPPVAPTAGNALFFHFWNRYGDVDSTYSVRCQQQLSIQHIFSYMSTAINRIKSPTFQSLQRLFIWVHWLLCADFVTITALAIPPSQ